MPDPSPARALLLDFDGTIADTLPLIFDAFRHAVSPFADRLPTDAEVEATFGPAERECLSAFAPEHCLDEAEARFFDHYEREHERMVRLADGMAGAIEHARSLGWKVGVFTGKGRRAALFSLEALGLLDRVDCVVSGDDVERPKPDPDGLHRAARLMGVDPGLVLMAGDSPADIRAGRSAGARTCAVTWAAFQPDRLLAEAPDHCCSRVDELVALIDSLHHEGRG
ncbi:HAD family hydrolase [Tautonia plasticadhaerens]|uniref:Pyrophosphatase PpaX n=1 Tax=Tautonia plasticadhaerens TaxID=2527974 RepID=A0A518HBY4_9BACT|nr:HAD-IA family hydrolase [Tautonia plasticadhaerens]QDV38360.1 Pyrophosphatase PpaX [Tautonia plasticadhaerens]